MSTHHLLLGAKLLPKYITQYHNYQNSQLKLFRVLAFGLAIAPAFYLAVLLLKYSVNLPYYDQWWVTATIVKAFEGKLSFYNLISLHNDSIKFFPRLIFISLAYLTKYDVRSELLLSFLIAVIISTL